ncbi:glycosyltransferase family 2 protein [Pseudanabaena sp. FACHB-2040]|uniref:glycosyltransferase family 2 protein n=1 Tax=Pseudanabaena sp. FACHB-2040 TaxID=2692859 RepID=UPI001682AF93|nr:glycosyltransferase family 2 protein [Pseudanabaena sp. FACHB-2040]MBD2260786.1 glycosyltransferase family 2 protein [Pseudanabaena sp. FACHB-2040]
MPCSTPVIFLIFRRPELTARVFEQIRAAQPSKLFVVADGPRNEVERVLCDRTRAVTEQINWDCEVFRNYSEENLGCCRRVTSGLTWAFEQVEEAIILEDDCLPHLDFFSFCQTLLSYYRDDKRVWVISGNNFQDGRWHGDGNYYFSKYNHCWGWATWQRAWQHWELNSKKWVEFRDAGLMHSICESYYETIYWTEIFNALFLEEKFNSWAYPWMFTCWVQSGLTALPNVNLVSNLGFEADATHTRRDSHLANLSTERLGGIKHPTFVMQDKSADLYTFNHYYQPPQGKLNLLLKKLRSRASFLGMIAK